MTDGETHVHCYNTTGKPLSRVTWYPLYQNEKGIFRTGKVSYGEAVVDHIPVDEEVYVLNYNVQLNPIPRQAH